MSPFPPIHPFHLRQLPQIDAGDVLTCWEQLDNQTGFTILRRALPQESNVSFVRSQHITNALLSDLQDLIAGSVSQWEVLPSVSRSMDFRVTVRDNASGGGCNDHADLTLTVDGSAGPFLVLNPNNTGITWDAATSETANVGCSGYGFGCG